MREMTLLVVDNLTISCSISRGEQHRRCRPISYTSRSLLGRHLLEPGFQGLVLGAEGHRAILQMPNSISHASPRLKPPLSTTTTTYVRSGLVSKIDYLCRALMCDYNTERCIGFLEDQSWRHHVYCVPGPGSSSQIYDMAPIKEAIYDTNSNVTTIEKYTLAYMLASAVLQLCDTPWLPTAWSSNDIFIVVCLRSLPIISCGVQHADSDTKAAPL